MALVALASCGEGLGDGGPEPVEVPVGLSLHCGRALDGGSLATDGIWREATLAKNECLLYRFATIADAQYTVQVLIEEQGNVDFIVSSVASFTDLVTAAMTFGDSPEGASFRAEATGPYHVAIVGQAETSAFTTRVVENVASPAGLDDCDATLDGGALGVDGPALSDLLFPGTCILYTFEGTADSIYRLGLTATNGTRPKGLHLARDRDFTDVVKSATFLGPETVLYPVLDATQTYYLIAVGQFSGFAAYDLALKRGNAPPGLTDLCFHAEAKGALAKDWTAVTGSLPERECHVFTVTGTAGLRYFVGPSYSTPDALLRIATDAAFRNLVPTVHEDVRDERAKAFVAGVTQTFHVAVLTHPPMREYTLRALESAPPPPALDFWCNRSSAKGSLVANAAATTSSVEVRECATYSLAVQAGVTYSLAAITPSSRVALFVAQDAAHTQSLGSSIMERPAQGFAFTAPATGMVHVAVAGRSPVSSFSLSATTTSSRPTGLSTQCTHAVSGGALTVGAAAKAGYAPDAHCVLYTFTGTSGTSYTLNVTRAAQHDNPDVILASNAAFTAVVDQEATTGSETIVFTASANQTFHVAVHGFQSAQFAIEVKLSPPPPVGLTGHCTSARDGGALVVGGAHVNDNAVASQCILFSFPASAGTTYTVTMYTSGGDPSLVVGSNATFTSVLTTQATPGGQTYTFQASATQSYHLAVFPANAVTTSFEIFVTSP